MTIGYILILAILILGGAIATLGDRIGTRVGKARLSLFKLRPRQTAVVVTIVTGIIIAGSTLGILFATSKPLRQGIFQLDEIQKKLRNASRDLEQVSAEKNQVEAKLAQSRVQQTEAQAKLNDINQSLQSALSKLDQAIAKQQETQQQFAKVQSQLNQTISQKDALRLEIKQLQTERQNLKRQQQQIKATIAQRDREIAQQDHQLAQKNQELTQRQQEISQQNQKVGLLNQNLVDKDQQLVDKDQLIVDRNQELQQSNQKLQQQQQEITNRDKILASRESRLKELEKEQVSLETQQNFLKQDILSLEQDFKELRLGNVIIRRGQVLATGIVRIIDPNATKSAVDKLLQKANQAVIKLGEKNNVNEQVIQISNFEVQSLMSQIKDGEEYVVRILGAANYLKGEIPVQVFADAVRNQVVFHPGDVVAETSVNPVNMSQSQIQQRIDQLLVASNFRARNLGILADTIQIGDGRITTLISFLEQLQKQTATIDIKAIAADVTYTAGPLKIQLVALLNGQIIFRT